MSCGATSEMSCGEMSTGTAGGGSSLATSTRRGANWLPIPASRAEQLTCPVLTLQNKSVEEQINRDVPDIRAYKLGKKRWSYNQFELRVHNEAADNALDVKEALQSTIPQSLQRVKDSSATYKVRLTNNFYVVVHVFVVYETALEVRVDDSKHGPQQFYQWICVDRTACKKGCNGPVLRPIQRFGRVGKRSGPDAPKGQASQLKNYKYMYLSLDEAGTHVGGSRFRLLFAVYDTTGSTLLGTTVSTPIRVLANNDVPTGAAHVSINVTLRSDWVGWYNVCPLTLKPLPQTSSGHDNSAGGGGGGDDRHLRHTRSAITAGEDADDEDGDGGFDGGAGGGSCGGIAHRLMAKAMSAPGPLDDTDHLLGGGGGGGHLSSHHHHHHPRHSFVKGGAGGSPDLLMGPGGAAPCISPGDSSFSSLTNNNYPGEHASPGSGLQPIPGGPIIKPDMELQELLRTLNQSGAADIDLDNNQRGLPPLGPDPSAVGLDPLGGGGMGSGANAGVGAMGARTSSAAAAASLGRSLSNKRLKTSGGGGAHHEEKVAIGSTLQQQLAASFGLPMLHDEADSRKEAAMHHSQQQQQQLHHLHQHSDDRLHHNTGFMGGGGGLCDNGHHNVSSLLGGYGGSAGPSGHHHLGPQQSGHHHNGPELSGQSLQRAAFGSHGLSAAALSQLLGPDDWTSGGSPLARLAAGHRLLHMGSGGGSGDQDAAALAATVTMHDLAGAVDFDVGIGLEELAGDVMLPGLSVQGGHGSGLSPRGGLDAFANLVGTPMRNGMGGPGGLGDFAGLWGQGGGGASAAGGPQQTLNHASSGGLH